MVSTTLLTCPAWARICVRQAADICQLVTLTLCLEDHVGVSTIVEVDTRDETMDVLVEPIYLKKHEEL